MNENRFHVDAIKHIQLPVFLLLFCFRPVGALPAFLQERKYLKIRKFRKGQWTALFDLSSHRILPRIGKIELGEASAS